MYEIKYVRNTDSGGACGRCKLMEFGNPENLRFGVAKF